MSFAIEIGPKAAKYFKSLPEDVALRITAKLHQIKNNPFRYLKHFEGKEGFKLRIGEYRAIIDADIQEKVLIVRMLDKRGRIYKR